MFVGELVLLRDVNQIAHESSETYRPYWLDPKGPTPSWWAVEAVQKGAEARVAAGVAARQRLAVACFLLATGVVNCSGWRQRYPSELRQAG